MFKRAGGISGIQLNALLKIINKCFDCLTLYGDHFAENLLVVAYNSTIYETRIYQHYFATVEINRILALYSSIIKNVQNNLPKTNKGR